MTRIALLTLDSLAAKMAGPAIRVWEMSRELAAHGHEVRLVTFGHADATHPGFAIEAVRVGDVDAIADWAQVLVVQGTLFHGVPALRTTSTPIVVDLYDPFHLEGLEVDRHQPLQRRWTSLRVNLAELGSQITRGDLFLAASEKQRDFWLGQLAGAGRLNPLTYDDDPDLRRLIATVPFGLAAEPPQRQAPAIRGVVDGIGADDRVIIWGGGVYNWFDPLTLVRAVDRARAEIPDLRLYFLGMKHPNPDVPAMHMAARTQELAAELGLTGRHVFFNYDWVDYDRRGDYLLDADLGVSCHYQHVETSFSFRTRILDYLWAGLPIVSTAGDTFAELIAAHDLGRVVPPEDAGALAAALVELLRDDRARSDCASNVTATAAQFRWDRVLAPLVEFCANPHRAADEHELPSVDGPGVARIRTGVVSDVRTTLQHFRQGGVGQVQAKAAARLRRRQFGR